MEAESGSPEGRRGWRCAAVRCAVVLSVCALLLSLAALALMLLITPQEPPRSPSSQMQPKDNQVCAPTLYIRSPLLKDGKLKWAVGDTAGCENLDQQFKYDNNFGTLNITSEGVYRIFLQVVTQCHFVTCEVQGEITFTVHHNSDPVLSLSLHLSPKSNKTISAFGGASFPLKKDDFLYVTLTASNSGVSTGFEKWQLQKESFLKVSKIPGNSVASN